ncbi:NAD(P)/FAD-dependent oxidoreductase [Falsochrobactrum sp. TDYN1]|uniref:NADH:ubiquinone reductase (non-electrogenic) n=1 Tax=Falsochrobactrum tianjinense TaxID=2706015 RepID=A0A949PLM5_9HYPH|nr:NAD(P)/FAD-dependent oxidoreductase [Falsochrobactrum sp. TDYN1]MBV2143541.1 NAD(P)/FAD-dependent oxidoreductase [Falsochrobactrum sp. TDYN1]
MSSHRIVIVGAGFAGLQVAKDLAGSSVDITIIDKRNHHLFQPLLYQVATTVLSTSEIAWPIRSLFRDRPDVRTLLGEVVSVDVEAKAVRLKEGTAVEYDTLVLATGARHAYFGHDEWEPYAPGLKTLEDATTIRRRLLLAFEKAELTIDPMERSALMTFGLIGGGPTGVELAGIIAELAQRTLTKEFRSIDTRKTRIVLVEAGPRLLPVFPESLSNYAANVLRRMQVDVRTGRPVTSCNDQGIVIGDEFMPCRTVIWAAGVQASQAAEWTGAEHDRAGRAIVENDLTIKDHSDIFVIGDTAAVSDQDGKPVPGIAPAAKQQGKYVAGVIRNRLSQRAAPGPFRYSHLGNLATIGPSAAVIDFGRIRLKGWLAWWIWGLAHIYFLIGTRSRMAVALSWLWAFVSGHHSARLITQKETLKDKV